jgi:hypothetical protein
MFSTTYTVTGTTKDGCTSSASVSVTTIESTVTARAENENLCLGASTILTASTSESGNFFYTWSPATGLNTTQGAIVIASPRVSTTYTVIRSGEGSCNTAVVRVNVSDGGNIAITGLKDSYCLTEGTVILTATPAGGTFSGNGIQGNAFSPSQAGEGAHLITYSGESNGCRYAVTRLVTVTSGTSAEITNLSPQYCVLNPAVTLTATPEGGTFSGNGITGNRFNPSQAGVGTHTITYSGIPTNGGCPFNITRQVIVTRVDADIENIPTSICATGTPITLTGVPSGGTFSGKGMSGNRFDPTRAGIGLASVTYFGFSNGCTYSITKIINVTNGIGIGFNTVNATCNICADGSITLLASGGTPPYQYSFDGGATFIPTNVQPNLLPADYNYVVRDASGCSASGTIRVDVGRQTNDCSAPTILSVTPARNNALVTWTNVPNNAGYTISWRINQPNRPFTSTNVGTDITSFNIRNLTPGTNYEVRIRTRCGTIVSSFSPATPFTTTSGRAGDHTDNNPTVEIYPNPSQGYFTLTLQNYENVPLNVSVFDGLGKLVAQPTITITEGQNEIPIDLTNLTKGVYYLHLSVGESNIHSKIVIE